MVKGIVLLFLTLTFFFTGFTQILNDQALDEIAVHRKKQQDEMRDPAKSRLRDKEEIKKFIGLNYFPPDLSYRVKAKFIKIEKPLLFKMKTSTTRFADYSKFGELRFTLNGVDYTLEVYQERGLPKEYADYLFVPFADKTNGNETYDIGRYIDIKIPDSDEVILDFNKCYNPYCSYNPNYSCEIPPEANNLPVGIRAGEKKYQKSK